MAGEGLLSLNVNDWTDLTPGETPAALTVQIHSGEAYLYPTVDTTKPSADLSTGILFTTNMGVLSSDTILAMFPHLSSFQKVWVRAATPADTRAYRSWSA